MTDPSSAAADHEYRRLRARLISDDTELSPTERFLERQAIIGRMHVIATMSPAELATRLAAQRQVVAMVDDTALQIRREKLTDKLDGVIRLYAVPAQTLGSTLVLGSDGSRQWVSNAVPPHLLARLRDQIAAIDTALAEVAEARNAKVQDAS